MHAYFFPATQLYLAQHLAVGPEVLLLHKHRAHSLRSSAFDYASWKSAYQPLNAQGIPVWESKVSSEVNLLTLEPRLEYICASTSENTDAQVDGRSTPAFEGPSMAVISQQILQQVVPAAAVPMVIKPAGNKGLGVFAAADTNCTEGIQPLCWYAGRVYEVNKVGHLPPQQQQRP